MQTILKIPGFMDNVFTHLLAGLGAGLFAVFIGSPVDVVGVARAPSPSFFLLTMHLQFYMNIPLIMTALFTME